MQRGTSKGPYLDGNGMYYVAWCSSQGEMWERWFHTRTIAQQWLAEKQEMHP